MPVLHLRTADGRERTVPLARRITTVGPAPDNDLVLPDATLPSTALHVHFDGRDFNAACHGGAEMEVNGKRKVTARLADGDRIRLGTSELVFSVLDRPADPAPAPAPGRVEALRSLARFSERLLARTDLAALL